jgi:hypothetical protein
MKLLIFIFCIFLIGAADPHSESEWEVRAEQERIKKYIDLSNSYNKQPSPTGNRRAARIARNRYRNNLPPVVPRTIYREPQHTRRSVRFYGGIPR